MSRFLDVDKVLVFQIYNDETEEIIEKEYTIEDFVDTFAVDGCPPTVDAEPIRHGKWLTKKYMDGLEDHEGEWIERLAEYGDCAYCSVCGGHAGLDYDEEDALTPYCPNCGAKMEEVEKDEIN